MKSCIIQNPKKTLPLKHSVSDDSDTSKLREIGGRAHFLLSLVVIRSISALICDSFIPPILFILKQV